MPKKKNLSEKSDKRRRRKFLGEDGRYHWVAAKTDGKANEALTVVAKKYGAGGVGDDGDVLVRDYVERYLEVKEGETAFTTYRSYRYQAVKYISGTIGGMKMSAVKPSDVQRVLAKTNDESAATRNRVVFLLKAIFKMADIDRLLYHNPTAGTKRTPDDAEKRVAFTEDEEGHIKTHFLDDGCLALPLLYYTGMRRGELYGLQWKFINLAAGKITVDQQAHETENGFVVDRVLKTTNSRRTIPIPPELVAILQPLRGLGDVFVLQTPEGVHYNARDVEVKLRWLREKLKMPHLLHHTFRHNYATKLYLAGIPVKEAAMVMGETVDIMLKTYVHIGKQLGDVAADKIKGVFSAPVAKLLPVGGENKP